MSEPRPLESITKVKELKPGMEHANVVIRVLESYGIRTIRTKAGERTIGEYVVGDETGRVKLVAWGTKAAALAVGDVAEIRGAWVSVFRGEVQLNIGRSSSIERLPDDAVVDAESIPEDAPQVPREYTSAPRPSRKPGMRSRGRKKGRRGGWL